MLQERISILEKRLAERAGPGMPGNKPPSGKPPQTAKVCQRRAHGYGRSRLPPTETVQHRYPPCPGCGTHLVGERQVTPVELRGGVLGPRHCLGLGLVSLIVTLR
jgi:hypothetical protein